MFPGSEDIICDEVIPPRVNNTTRKRNSAATQLPTSSNLDDATSSGEVYSFLGLLKATPTNGMGLSFQHENHFTGGKTGDAKPPKKARAKAGPKSRKKGKVDVAPPVVNDEALDSDLCAIVGSFDPNKMDSDSSTDTLINEEINKPINESSFFKNVDHLVANMKLFTNAPQRVNKSIFSSSSKDDNQQKCFGPVAGLPIERFESLSFPVKSKSCKEVIHIPSADVSSLNVHNDYSPNQISSGSTNSHSILRNLITGECNSTLPKNYQNKSRTKSKKNIFPSQSHDATFSQQKPLDTTNLHTSSLCQSDQTVNSQSFYASMGLDEDLCDSVSKKSNKTSKVKSTAKKLSSPSTSKSNSVSAPIKIERDDSKDEMLSSNGLHVTMTFEAEPPCEEEEEDDLPLSLLKSQIPADETLKGNVKSQEVGNFIQQYDDIHPSMFIKKELIEDEIVSESEAISSNLLTVSNSNFSFQNRTPASSTQNDLSNVKIKTEPVVDHPNSESSTKSFSQHSTNYDSQRAAKITDSVLEVFHKNKLDNNRHAISKDNTLNFPSKASANTASITGVSETKSLEQLNALCVGQVSEPSFKAINSTESNLDTSTSNKKQNGAGNKKSRVKINNLTRKNVLKNTSFYQNKHIKSLFDENDQSVKLNSDSSSVSSLQQVTDNTDTESNSSKKKGKRKKNTNQSVKIDENAPITLLIKRKKTDSADDWESDSFLCTSVSKSNADESQLSLKDSSCDKVPFINESETKEAHTSFENAVAPQVMPKRQRKRTRKRQTKKGAKQGISINSIPEKRDDALVIMDFEEQSPDEILEECNSTLSVNKNNDSSYSDNLIQSLENDSPKLPSVAQSSKQVTSLESKMERKLSEPTCNTTEATIYLPTDETLSSSVTSNSNVENDSFPPNSVSSSNSTANQTTPSKTKKKRKGRKMNWYKKKKNKFKDVNQASPTVEIKEPQPDSSKINALLSMNKVPVVVIRNLLPEIKDSSGTETSPETYFSPSQKLVETSPVNGKKRKGTKSRKRKKWTKGYRRDKANENLQSVVPESSTIVDNPEAPNSSAVDSQSSETNLRNNFVQISEPVSRESCNNLVSVSENTSKLQQDEIAEKRTNKEVTNQYSSLFNKEIGKSNPLLHSLGEEEIETYRQEIRAFEAIFQKRNESFLSKSSLRIPEAVKYNGPLSQSIASEPNILEAFKSSFKTVESNCGNLIEISPDIQIKKEKYEMQSSNSTSEVSFLPNTNKNNDLSISSNAQRLTSEKVSGGGENENSLRSFSSNVMSSNSALLNKEQVKSSDSQNAIEVTRPFTSVNNTILIPQDSRTNTVLGTSSPGLIPDMTRSCLENPESNNLDHIALSIKKEVARLTLSKSPNVSFKDQHDLIQKVHEVRSENSTSTNSNFKDTLVQKQLDQPLKSNFATPQVKGHVEDDEIEIVMVTNKESKVLDVVDLTDENCTSDSLIKKQEISEEHHNQDNFVSVNSIQKITAQNEAEREINAHLNTTKSNSLSIHSENILRESVQLKTFNSINLNSNAIPNHNAEVNSSFGNKTSFTDKNNSTSFLSEAKDTFNANESLSTDEKDERYCPGMIQICNSDFAGDKYINEYFKHPFPYSSVSYNSKQRNRNKIYTRNNSISWNLNLDEVESRLKRSEMPQFGKKLGDIVRLEKYPVSVSEVECYHRILGVAPSQKLLSKCFRPPENKNQLDMFLGFQQSNKFEGESLNNQISLQDVLQGIAETKLMYSKNNPYNSHPVYERDCPSADTRDSFDSHVSNTSTSLNKNAKSSNILANNEMIYSSMINDTGSNGGNTASSHSDLNETINKESPLNFIPQQSCQAASVGNFTLNETVNYNSTNLLSYLNLPSKETINTLLSNTVSSSTVDRTCDTIKNSFPELRNNSFASNDSYSLPSSFPPLNTNFESNSELKHQNHTKETSNVIDVPNVNELRKILETAGNLSIDTAYDQELMWKSKATYEYNHIRSVPVPDDNSAHVNVNTNSFNSEFASDRVLQNAADRNSNAVKETCPAVSEECSANNVQDDSDDDYIDNEPLPNEDADYEPKTKEDADYEPKTNEDANNEPMTNEDANNEPMTNDDEERDSSHAEDETDKEKPIPQYKSKWEKIMERKSLENADEIKKNPYVLKDCFPVSTTQKKNEKVSDKNIAKPPATLETSNAEKVSGDKQKKKKSSTKKSSKKDKTKESTKKQEKNAAESPKKKKEKNKCVAEKGSKKPVVVSKKKGGKVGDVSSLFVPDKPVKISKEKTTESPDKSAENNKSKKFYGNRITNRGSFLTESSSSIEKLKNIKIPKKKTQEVPKKCNNVRSEEFHSIIKSPVINIDTNYGSPYNKTSYKRLDKQKNEFFRSPLENSVPSATSHYIRTKKMRDKTLLSNAYQNKFQTDRRPPFNAPHLSPSCDSRSELGRRPPFSGIPPSVTSVTNDEYSHSRRSLLSTPPSNSPHFNEEYSLNRSNICSPPSMSPYLLNDESISPSLTLPSVASQPDKRESFSDRQFSDLLTQLTQPSTSSQSTSSNFQSILKPENMNILNDIISALQTKPSVPEINKNILPFSDPRTPKYNFDELNSIAYGSSKVSVKNTVTESSTIVPGSFGSVNKPVLNTPSQGQFDLLKSTQTVQNIPLKKQLDTPFNSDVLHSAQLVVTPVNPTENTQVPPQPKKAICLVPQHLKSLVGHKIIETHNVRLLMLEWSVDWLVQQQRFSDPPPISNDALKKVVGSYDSFEDYYNTFFPLMLLETWHRIYVSWTHLNQASPYLCQIISYSVKQHYVSIECHTVFNTAAHPKGVFPDEGSILMVKYTTKSHQFTIKTLGYVTNVKTRRFNSVTDSKMFSSLKSHKDVNPDLLQILTLTFMGAYNSEDIDKREPIRIHVLCNVKPALKQNDALLYINKSPLQRIILNPVADGNIRSHSLTPRNSPLEKVNDCVRDITLGILAVGIPLLTVVRAKPESDRLNIIPLLIEKMKTAYKTKVLLCVRTVRALGDIAANICLHQSLKMVIINKRCDTNPQFQKYLLDEAATAEISKTSEDKVGEKIHIKNEVAMKAKKQILKDCDVVLSLIRNCHDEFLKDTFEETDCVSQMCCIIDEANLCTEPESLIPILHGISKLILIGDPDYPARVLSKTANSYDYSQSFFQRAYDLDLIST